MKTRERIAALASSLQAFPELGIRSSQDLEQWMELELGHSDALEMWSPYGPSRTRAIAPRFIYHILAGNLPLSGINSLVIGLLLGSHNWIKLPSAPSVHHALHTFIASLPQALQDRIETKNKLHRPWLEQAEAVVAYGSDTTMENLFHRLRWNQRFLPYGHQLSFIWLQPGQEKDPEVIGHCAHDTSLYDQLGCLSPQAIFINPSAEISTFCSSFAQALEAWNQQYPSSCSRLEHWSRSASVQEARDVASALGLEMWKAKDLSWTVILDPRPQFDLSPLHRVIIVRPLELNRLTSVLRPFRNHISSVGLAGSLEPEAETLFTSLGVHRFCSVGHMQHPQPFWHHDGQPQLTPFLRWIDDER